MQACAGLDTLSSALVKKLAPDLWVNLAGSRSFCIPIYQPAFPMNDLLVNCYQWGEEVSESVAPVASIRVEMPKAWLPLQTGVRHPFARAEIVARQLPSRKRPVPSKRRVQPVRADIQEKNRANYFANSPHFSIIRVAELLEIPVVNIIVLPAALTTALVRGIVRIELIRVIVAIRFALVWFAHV